MMPGKPEVDSRVDLILRNWRASTLARLWVSNRGSFAAIEGSSQALNFGPFRPWTALSLPSP